MTDVELLVAALSTLGGVLLLALAVKSFETLASSVSSCLLKAAADAHAF
jgi:hypothetical protein